MRKLFTIVLVLFALTTTLSAQQIYEWRVYDLADKVRLDNFFQDALIPAYNRLGVKVGAYGEYSQSLPEKQYYLFVYADMQTYIDVNREIWNDKIFADAAKDEFSAVKPSYNRYDTYLCEAFEGFGGVKPDVKYGLFELRTYEGANEDAVRRKVEMFNIEEIALFEECRINPYLFSRIVAGPKMPAVLYLVAYENMEARDRAWGVFGSHPKWVEMRDRPQYANTVSLVHQKFLVPMSYSQL